MINAKHIRKAIRKQSQWLQDLGRHDRRGLLSFMDRDRRQKPARKDLIPYIARHTGKIIPYRKVCRDHDAPADFLDHMMYEETDALALACRSGGKTFQFGIAAGMDAYHDVLSTRVLGGSGDQSAKVYKEFANFMRCGFDERVLGEILQKRTEIKGGGSRAMQRCEVELLMASATSVHGPHVPRLKMDEIDEMIKDIFDAAMSILQSDDGRRAALAMASTRHHPFGIMADQVEEFHGRLLTWCVFEIMTACKSKKECRSCNLSKYCPGWDVMKNGVGYYTLHDAQGQRNRLKDDETYEAYALCWKPRTEGVIYLSWKKKHHMPGRIPINKQLPLYRVFDYGTDHPTVLGYWQLVKTDGRWQGRLVDEKRWRGKAPSVIVKEMIKYELKMGYNWIDDTLVPMDAASFRAELVNAGIETSTPDQAKEDGVDTVKNLLVADENGTMGLIISTIEDEEGVKSCEETAKEMSTYHRKNGIIQKKKDDGPDMVRYFCHTAPELRTDPGGVFVDLGGGH